MDLNLTLSLNFPSLEENAEAEDDRIAEETEELFKDRIETAEEIFKRKYGGNKLFVFLGKYNRDFISLFTYYMKLNVCRHIPSDNSFKNSNICWHSVEPKRLFQPLFSSDSGGALCMQF